MAWLCCFLAGNAINLPIQQQAARRTARLRTILSVPCYASVEFEMPQTRPVQNKNKTHPAACCVYFNRYMLSSSQELMLTSNYSSNFPSSLDRTRSFKSSSVSKRSIPYLKHKI